VDVGIRVLAILTASFPNAATIDRLSLLDYLVVHTDDLDGGPPGINPKTPHRAVGILVRRESIQAGVALLQTRGLVRQRFDSDAVRFAATDSAGSFVDAMTSPYASKLRSRASWLADRLGMMEDADLQRLVAENLGRWGAEFEWDPLPEAPSNG
jgi:hypothetical protein